MPRSLERVVVVCGFYKECNDEGKGSTQRWQALCASTANTAVDHQHHQHYYVPSIKLCYQSNKSRIGCTSIQPRSDESHHWRRSRWQVSQQHHWELLSKTGGLAGQNNRKDGWGIAPCTPLHWYLLERLLGSLTFLMGTNAVFGLLWEAFRLLSL